MDWLPNEEGIRWLVTKVWPQVTHAHPKAQLHLAGNKMPQDLIDLKMPGLSVMGRVENADHFMAQHHVMVVPLFSGGGMRVKIIEGMAMGKCVISTTMGAEGIACQDGRDVLLADTPEAMARSIGSIIDDPTLATRIGQQARELVLSHYSNDIIVRDLIAFFRLAGQGMKLLVVLSRVPFPLEKGDKLRAYHLVKRLAMRHEVYLFCLTDQRVMPGAPGPSAGHLRAHPGGAPGAMAHPGPTGHLGLLPAPFPGGLLPPSHRAAGHR